MRFGVAERKGRKKGKQSSERLSIAGSPLAGVDRKAAITGKSCRRAIAAGYSPSDGRPAGCKDNQPNLR